MEGLQSGAGVGAWAGFGFGLIDGFFLSEYDQVEPGYGASVNHQPSRDAANGLLTVQSNTGFSIGFVNPSIYHVPELQNQQLTIHNRLGLELTNFSISF